MDPVTLATTVLAVLTPYLAKAGEKLANNAIDNLPEQGELFDPLGNQRAGFCQDFLRRAGLLHPALVRDDAVAAVKIAPLLDFDKRFGLSVEVCDYAFVYVAFVALYKQSFVGCKKGGYLGLFGVPEH